MHQDIITMIEKRLNVIYPTADGVSNYLENETNRQYAIPRHIPPIQVGNERFPLYVYIDPQAN
jgi:hypothetical protein